MISVIATCFIVLLSFSTTLSASTIVVAEADVPPSIILISAAVEVTPSRIFNSAAVVVTAVPPINNLSFTMFIVATPAVSSELSDSSHNRYAPDVAPKNLTSSPVSSTPTVNVPSNCTAPSISTASKFVIPSISALPDTSKVAASSSPVNVAFPLE